MYSNLFKPLNISPKQDFVRSHQTLEVIGKDITRNDGTKLYDASQEQFVTGSLERIDPKVYKPLKSFFWFRDMPIMPGGGALEFSSFYRASYEVNSTTSFATSGQANVIATVKANIEKYITIVKAYAWNTTLGWIDEMRMAQVGSSIPQLQIEGVMLYYNQKLDDIAFFGMLDEGNDGAYGLLNNADISATPAAKKWIDISTPANSATPTRS